MLAFAFISYFMVCGGPIGIEYCVIYGGPLLTLVGFLSIPLLWSVPQALMAAELSTALPDNGGYVLWAQYSFGDFVGFLSAFNGVFSSLVDSTLYPVLVATYLASTVAEIGADGNTSSGGGGVSTTLSPAVGNFSTTTTTNGTVPGADAVDWFSKGSACLLYTSPSPRDRG